MRNKAPVVGIRRIEVFAELGRAVEELDFGDGAVRVIRVRCDGNGGWRGEGGSTRGSSDRNGRRRTRQGEGNHFQIEAEVAAVSIALVKLDSDGVRAFNKNRKW